MRLLDRKERLAMSAIGGGIAQPTTNWSTADRPLFPSAPDRQHRNKSGSYRPLPSGSPTFRNRPDLGVQNGKADRPQLGIRESRLKV